LSDDIRNEFIIWRLVVLEKCATLTELENWTLEDVMKANAILDMKHDIEKSANANNSRSSR
jgi:hypothetical protein